MSVYEYLQRHKGEATISKLFILAELILFEDEEQITKPVCRILESYFRNFAADTHDHAGEESEGVEQYAKGIEIAQDLIYGIDKEAFEALKGKYIMPPAQGNKLQAIVAELEKELGEQHENL